MTVRRPAKVSSASTRLVAVIASETDLIRTGRMRTAPDLFELRLDSVDARAKEAREAIARLPAPVIVTARHPREGGLRNLTTEKRALLLEEFLPSAEYIDIELRSASR